MYIFPGGTYKCVGALCAGDIHFLYGLMLIAFGHIPVLLQAPVQ